MPTISLVVTAGTDDWPFARLSDWVEEWLSGRVDRVSCLFQEGSSRVPQRASGLGIIPRSELLAMLSRADVVVTQAGPGSIRDAHEAGVKPIVVPRRRLYGEAVDDHQVDFARAAAGVGWVHLAETRQQLLTALDRACDDPDSVAWHAPVRHVAPETVDRLSRLVEQSARSSDQGIRLRRVPQAIRMVIGVFRAPTRGRSINA